MFFMDTDPAFLLDSMAGTCASSPYTIDEIEEILFQEVLPACRFNMFAGVAPEWAGFEAEWLKKRILKRQRFWGKRPWLLRKYTSDWVGSTEACRFGVALWYANSLSRPTRRCSRRAARGV